MEQHRDLPEVVSTGRLGTKMAMPRTRPQEGGQRRVVQAAKQSRWLAVPRPAARRQANIYEDRASGGRDDRPGLAAWLKSLRDGDVLVVWKLDRLGRSLAHLVNIMKDLSDRNIGLRVLTGKGAQIDTTTASGPMVFGIFGTLAESERDLIRERTMAGLAAADRAALRRRRKDRSKAGWF